MSSCIINVAANKISYNHYKRQYQIFLIKYVDSLQTQESKLSEQIKSTSVALGKYPASSAQLVSNRKSKVVVYGVNENPPKTPRNVQLQKDIETVL